MKKGRVKQSGKSVDELVAQWTRRSGASQEYSAIRDLLFLLSDELYDQYQPIAEKPPFWEQLGRWLNNVKSERQQKTLLTLVLWLLFIGQKELETMYRAAFSGPITRWIIDEAGLDISSQDLSADFARELRRTFFGSIAGMEIGSFARINNLPPQGHRPNFRELAQLGDYRLFQQTIIGKGYERFVAVEDMVGTGTQMVEAAPLLEYLQPHRVLFCPIVVAPSGISRWRDELQGISNFSFAPLFVIPENATVPQKQGKANAEANVIREFRNLLNATWKQVKGNNPNSQLYSAFGFGDFGSLVLSYLNCPDNVPPLIHYESDHWIPLFPRVSREG